MLQKAKESMYNIDATIARWSRNIFSHNNSSQVVPILIGTNIGVWSLWNFWGLKDTQNYHFMMDHFTISLKNLQEGRIHTLLTSAFSQISTDHILLNCLTIYFLVQLLLCAIPVNE